MSLYVAFAPVADVPRVELDPAEIAYCTGLRRADEHLAARVLARHAVAAALGWPGEPPWRDIAIRREASGRPYAVLSGALAGCPVPGVSLSHAGGHAAALAWLR
jgi:holo-[acyl-carrier protein] synthase